MFLELIDRPIQYIDTVLSPRSRVYFFRNPCLIFFFLFSFFKMSEPLILMHQMHQDLLTVCSKAWCLSVFVFARQKIASIFVSSEAFLYPFFYWIPQSTADSPFRHYAFAPQSPSLSPKPRNPCLSQKAPQNAPCCANLPFGIKKLSPFYSQVFSYLAPNLRFPLKRKLRIYLERIVKGSTFALAFKDSGSVNGSSWDYPLYEWRPYGLRWIEKRFQKKLQVFCQE